MASDTASMLAGSTNVFTVLRRILPGRLYSKHDSMMYIYVSRMRGPGISQNNELPT